VMASPDFSRLSPPGFECDELPLRRFPGHGGRWARPDLAAAVSQAQEDGVWSPELHGLHHTAEAAWLQALRRGAVDARRAFEHECTVCEVGEASGEYDPTEPLSLRTRNLARAVECFRETFGRNPTSMCPPDYRWDATMDGEAEQLGVRIIQGEAERAGASMPRLRRLWYSTQWPDRRGVRFHPPPRIAFEPRGSNDPEARLGAATTHRACRSAWSRGQPAIVSTHRRNYAHLDPAWSETGRAALRDLLARLALDGALIVTDAEVHALLEHGWSARTIGSRGALVRYYGVPGERVRFAAPPGVAGVRVAEGPWAERARVTLDAGRVEATVSPGETMLEWSFA
jgi:hypothetical protein